MKATTPGKYGARLIAQTRRDIAAAFERTTEGRGLEAPDSVRRRLIEWLDDNDTDTHFFRGVASDNMEDAIRLLAAADQHADAMEQLLESGRALATLPTLQRGLIESVLILCYVHDTNVPPERTMLRMLARSLDMFEGSERTSLRFPRTVMGARRTQIQDAASGVRKLFTANGVTVAPFSRGGTPHLGLANSTESVKFDATAAARQYLGVDAHHWEMGSGGTHSKSWFLPTITAGLTEDALSSELEVVGASVLGALSAARALLRALSSHTGHSTRTEQERVFAREKVLVHRVNGMGLSPISLTDYELRGPDWRPSRQNLGAFIRAQ